MRLLTNNPAKVAGLEAAGVTVIERVPHKLASNRYNERYLATKRDRTGHPALSAGHVLDRPVWHALSERQRELAVGDDRALRFDPAVALFAAAADDKPDSLSALASLVPEVGVIGMVENREPSLPPALKIVKQSICMQMVAERPRLVSHSIAGDRLCAADSVQMLELASATEPGPFCAQAYRLGDYIGSGRTANSSRWPASE